VVLQLGFGRDVKEHPTIKTYDVTKNSTSQEGKVNWCVSTSYADVTLVVKMILQLRCKELDWGEVDILTLILLMWRIG
jgi:hypothetical protein